MGVPRRVVGASSSAQVLLNLATFLRVEQLLQTFKIRVKSSPLPWSVVVACSAASAKFPVSPFSNTRASILMRSPVLRGLETNLLNASRLRKTGGAVARFVQREGGAAVWGRTAGPEGLGVAGRGGGAGVEAGLEVWSSGRGLPDMRWCAR